MCPERLIAAQASRRGGAPSPGTGCRHRDDPCRRWRKCSGDRWSPRNASLVLQAGRGLAILCACARARPSPPPAGQWQVGFVDGAHATRGDETRHLQRSPITRPTRVRVRPAPYRPALERPAPSNRTGLRRSRHLSLRRTHHGLRSPCSGNRSRGARRSNARRTYSVRRVRIPQSRQRAGGFTDRHVPPFGTRWPPQTTLLGRRIGANLKKSPSGKPCVQHPVFSLPETGTNLQQRQHISSYICLPGLSTDATVTTSCSY